MNNNKNYRVTDYDFIADDYSETIEKQPLQTLFLRPQLMSILPKNIEGLRVLDLGCGSGWYCNQLIKLGADVVGLDLSEKMLHIAQNRLGNYNCLIRANLEYPLSFFHDCQFDVILSSCVIHYVKNWQLLFSELSRILANNGFLVFSIHHPHIESEIHDLDNYYDMVLVNDYWPTVDAKVTYYHRSLEQLIRLLGKAGFTIEQFSEPKPGKSLKISPEIYEVLAKKPMFLFVSAKKNINLLCSSLKDG